jgi:hypothetical protein
VAGGDPNLYRYCINNPVNFNDPSGRDIQEAADNLIQHRFRIQAAAKRYGIQPELLAGVVFVEGYSSGIPHGHTLNDWGSRAKFIAGMTATLGMTQFGIDPRKTAGCDTLLGRIRFLHRYLRDYDAQLDNAAGLLKYLAQLKYGNRYSHLSHEEMAMVLSGYNRGDKWLKRAKAPTLYGQRFLAFRNWIGSLLCRQWSPMDGLRTGMESLYRIFTLP